jgi:hypothetical protein
MKKTFKILLIAFLVCGSVLSSFADRGLRKKSRSHIALNINTEHGFKNNISLNLKSGLKYKGMLLTRSESDNFSNITFLKYYQKGNTLYILPPKQKILSTELKQGYAGLKLLITAKN